MLSMSRRVYHLLITHDYKELNFKVEKCLINKFLYKKKIEVMYYKKVEV